MNYLKLATTDMEISEIALGCWPMAGITSPGATEENSIATIQTCFELGVNHLDTAYCYGHSGESDRLIGKALGARRDETVIATKCGIHWDEQGNMVKDGRPATLRRESEESLRRMGTDRVELLYLHAPDNNVPVAESAGELKRLLDEGKTRSVGVSNANLAQLEQFAANCPVAAYQPAYNILQRQIEADTLPWCRERGITVMVYWVLLKGLLAGKIARDHVFAETDSRRKYPMFRGEEWQKNHDLLDRLRQIAGEAGRPVVELVINWTLRQPGIGVTLCGAKRPEQIRETAAASEWQLTDEQLARIDRALADRGEPQGALPV